MAPGFGGNLARRVATALIGLPAILLALFLGPPSLAVGLVAAAVAIGLAEFFRLLRAREIRPLQATGFAVAAALFLDVVSPSWYGAPVWPLAALLLLTVTLHRAATLADTVPAAAATLLGATYLGALGGTIGALRVLSPVAEGAWRMVLLLAIIMAADTAAFFVGLPGFPPARPWKAPSGECSGVSRAPWPSARSACPACRLPTRLPSEWGWRSWGSWATSSRA